MVYARVPSHFKRTLLFTPVHAVFYLDTPQYGRFAYVHVLFIFGGEFLDRAGSSCPKTQ
jgi:hypothetical protein